MLAAQTPSPTSVVTATVTVTATATVTATPTIAPEVYCPNSQAQLTNPTAGAEVTGAVEIRGSADIPNFWYYKFELRGMGGGSWAFLQRFDAPVTDGVLGTWDTGGLVDGRYKLRLVVVDTTGNYPEPCEVEVVVRH
jgi:hypothetical protein